MAEVVIVPSRFESEVALDIKSIRLSERNSLWYNRANTPGVMNIDDHMNQHGCIIREEGNPAMNRYHWCTWGVAIFMLISFGVVGAEEAENYGNTPDDLKPFARFVEEPYKRFFTTPLEFTGPGKDKPEPDVETVKIGLLAPLERSHESYLGLPMLYGVQMALEEANAAGGYHGKPFELVVRNDTGLWGASANEIVGFSYDDKVWGVIGSIDGANTHIAIRVALKTEIPVINVGDTDPTLVETKIPWIFRNIPDDRQMIYTLAYYIYKQRGFEKVAIFRADNRYGRFGVAEFREGSVRLGKPAPIEINYEINYQRVNPNFDIQMKRLQHVQPDAILLWADADAAGHIVEQIRQRGMQFPIFACNRVVNPRFLEIAGDAAEGVVAAFPFDPDEIAATYQPFEQRYYEQYGEKPYGFAAYAYDGANMLIEAIRQAGLNRYRIRDALAEMKSYHGVTGQVEMDDVYSNRSLVTAVTVRDGDFRFGEPKLEQRF